VKIYYRYLIHLLHPLHQQILLKQITEKHHLHDTWPKYLIKIFTLQNICAFWVFDIKQVVLEKLQKLQKKCKIILHKQLNYLIMVENAIKNIKNPLKKSKTEFCLLSLRKQHL
jgi:hypothetical protein